MTPQILLEQVLTAKATSDAAFIGALVFVTNSEPEQFRAFLVHLTASVLQADQDRDTLGPHEKISERLDAAKSIIDVIKIEAAIRQEISRLTMMFIDSGLTSVQQLLEKRRQEEA